LRLQADHNDDIDSFENQLVLKVAQMIKACLSFLDTICLILQVESTEEIESLGKELAAKDAEIRRLEGALREATKGGGLQALLDEERAARAAAEKGQREAEGVIAIKRGQLAEAERGREEAQAGLAAAREESTSLR
jgi:hypothetical protein